MRIKAYSEFIKFSLSSGSSFLIDLFLFQCFLILLSAIFPELEEPFKIWISTIVSRVLSSLFNYIINKILVFNDNSKTHKSLVKYYILCIAQMCCSALIVSMLYMLICINETIIKFFVDIILFIISYQIQKRLIFNNREDS